MINNRAILLASDPCSPNTTYVQADPSNFRAVVQKLTGAPSEDPSFSKLPITLPPRFSNPNPKDIVTNRKRPAFKLHERRHQIKKLDHLSLAGDQFSFSGTGGVVASSPVSTLDFFGGRGNHSPRTPRQYEEREEEEEDLERDVIAEKGFYLRRLSSSSSSEPPQLLLLFPIHSHTDTTSIIH